MIGLGVGIDYALFILTRFRNGLDEGLEQARRGDRRRRHRRPRGPLRRDHGDHLADGDAAARPHLPLRGGDGGGDRGAVHDDRGADPAAGAADDRRATGSTGCASRASAAAPAASTKTRCWFRWSREIQRRPVLAALLSGALLLAPLHPDPLAAARHQRRRHRPGGDDHARSLRPARRRLRPRLQRPVRDRRGAAREGRRRRRCRAAHASSKAKKASQRSPTSPSTRPKTPASSRSTRRPRRRARRRPNCSTTSATT